MKNKFKGWFYSLFYSLSNALKSTEEQILTSQDLSIGSESSIHKEVNDKRLAKHLVKGEITQEVIEMRYRDYKISREAAKYKYNGDGTATKIIQEVEDIARKEFIQDNKLIVEGVLDVLKQNAIDTSTQYNLTVYYQDIPRFRLESFCTRFDVSLKKKNITLHFEKIIDETEKKTRMFSNELRKLIQANTQVEQNRSEFTNNVVGFSFVTTKAIGEDDLVSYSFTNVHFDKIIEEERNIKLIYAFGEYERVDLTDKFYCKELDEKYSKKEAKRIEGQPILNEDIDKKYYCAMCGKEVHPIDAKLTKESIGYPLCQECLLELDKMGQEN